MDRIGICIREDRPSGIDRLREDERITHCAMVSRAREGEIFYASPENFKCALSRFNLGLQRRVDLFRSSLIEYLIAYGHAQDEKGAKEYLESKPKLKECRKYLLYFPVGKGEIEPDVVIFIGRPVEMMGLVHKIAKETGEALKCYLNGVSAMCGEVVVFPLVTERPNLSLGCCGARDFGKLRDDELLLGIPIIKRYKAYGL